MLSASSRPVDVKAIPTNMPSADIVIRPATTDDVPVLSRFLQPFIDDGVLLPRTRRELSELQATGFIAESANVLVGFAALEVYSRKMAEVRSLAVSPEHQGGGIGKQLVTACVEKAREMGILEVMAITSSESFFRACGFDFTLPGEKKALFIHTRDEDD